MKSASSFIPALATAALHVALIALAIIGLNSEQKKPAQFKPVPVQLLQAQKKPQEQSQAQSIEPQQQQQQPHRKERDKVQTAKSHDTPTPVPPPREHTTAAAKPSEVPAVAAAPDSTTTTAPPPPRSNISAPSAAPSSPVRHGAFVDPTYLATETEKWYPRQARRYGDQGTALLHVSVNAAGRAEKVELRKGSGYPLLDSAAIDLAKSITFQPATLDGKPVPDSFNLPITFKLHD